MVKGRLMYNEQHMINGRITTTRIGTTHEEQAMKTKNLTTLICLCALFLSITSCGAAALSDAEFAEAALPACEALATGIDALEDMDYAGRAEAYRLAAEALEAFNISEQSAPQGTLLRTSLAELPEGIETFAAALAEALTGAGMETPAMLMTTEDGNVFASPGSIFDMAKLDIDPAVVLALTAKLAALKEAASAAGLEQCAPE